MKYILIIMTIAFIAGCKSAEKYDFSNVQSTGMDAMHNPGVRIHNPGDTIVIREVDNDTLKK